MTETEKAVATPEQTQEALTITVKQFMDGVSTVFYGVTQILQSITPSVARALVDDAIGKDEKVEGDESDEKGDVSKGDQNQAAGPADDAGDSGASDAGGEQPAVESGATEPVEPEPEPQKKRKVAKKAEPEPEPESEPQATEAPATTITVDDITKIIVRKIKQDPKNNTKIGAVLKSFGVAKISELPASRYEAFLTDLSQI